MDEADTHEFDLVNADVYAIVLQSDEPPDFMWRCECGASGRGEESKAKHRLKHRPSKKVDIYFPEDVVEQLRTQMANTRRALVSATEMIPEPGSVVSPEGSLVFADMAELQDFIWSLLNQTYDNEMDDDGEMSGGEVYHYMRRVALNKTYFKAVFAEHQLATAKRNAQRTERDRGE